MNPYIKFEIDWVNTIISPIIQKLSQELSLPIYSIIGPLGPFNEICAYLSKSSQDLKELNMLFLTFTPYHLTPNFKLHIKNYITQLSDELICTSINLKPILQTIKTISQKETICLKMLK